MPELNLRSDILPPAQLRLWEEELRVPSHFVLYGGTALALRLGHRQSIDFDFFTAVEFVPDALLRSLPGGDSATLLQSERNTLTILMGGEESVKLPFFGGLGFRQ